jgi:hypothetical protein
VGALAAVPVFVSVFREFDTLMLFVPLGVPLLIPAGLGYAGGWWLLRR